MLERVLYHHDSRELHSGVGGGGSDSSNYLKIRSKKGVPARAGQTPGLGTAAGTHPQSSPRHHHNHNHDGDHDHVSP